MTTKDYPGILERVKALFIDSILLILAMMIITDVFSQFDDLPNYVRIIAFIVVFIIYDPLCTSLLGGTVGHIVIGIRVRRAKNYDKNIQFPQALLRYIIKIGLGWISLLTVTGNAKKQAIHDFLADSVVLNKEG